MSQLSQYWQSNGDTSLWNLVTGLASGVISVGLIIGAFVIFPLCYLIFAVFYAMYGAVLYVTGPFVLALLPTRSLGQLSRTYIVNLMTFQAWGLIYAVLQVLMSAVNLSSIDAVLNANGVLSSFVGSSQMILLALIAIIFSFSIVLIPFIASRIVRGDVGSTMMTLASALTTTAGAAAGMAAASLVGVGEGAVAGASGGTAPSLSTAAAGAPAAASLGQSAASLPGGTFGAATVAVASASMSPKAPPAGAVPATTSNGTGDASLSPAPVSSPSERNSSSSTAGHYRAVNAPHAMAWYVGYSLGSAYRGLKGGE
jgi:hypothetical protein